MTLSIRNSTTSIIETARNLVILSVEILDEVVFIYRQNVVMPNAIAPKIPRLQFVSLYSDCGFLINMRYEKTLGLHFKSFYNCN